MMHGNTKIKFSMEVWIPRRGCLKFRMCDWGKITKHTVSVRVVREAVSGYVCKIKIYVAEGQKLDDTASSVAYRKWCHNHRIYHAIFVTVWEWLKHCQTEKWEFVALWELTRGIPPDLECEANHWKTGQSAFQRKGDITVQVWTDKRLVWPISTIHDTTVLNTGR